MKGAGRRGGRGNCSPDVIYERKINTKKEKNFTFQITSRIHSRCYVCNILVFVYIPKRSLIKLCESFEQGLTV